MRYLALASVLLLAACSDKPIGNPVVEADIIRNVSFEPAHEERHCSKGCHYDAIPDTWYLQICDTKRPSDCSVRSITHAPWKWQTEGSLITVTWQQWDNGWRRRWYIQKIVITATGEEVVL